MINKSRIAQSESGGSAVDQPSVIVIEQEDALRRVVAASLDQAGLEVTAVAGSKEAATMIKHRSYDLLIISVEHPCSVHQELIKQYRNMNESHGGRIVVTTGERLSAAWKERLHNNETVYKPYDIRHLCRVAKRLVTPSSQAMTAKLPGGATYDRKSV